MKATKGVLETEATRRQALKGAVGLTVLSGSIYNADSIFRILTDAIGDTGLSDKTIEFVKKVSNDRVDENTFQQVSEYVNTYAEPLKNNKQLIFDAVLSTFFFLKILPLFLTEKSHEALTLSLPAVGAWYAFSQPDRKSDFNQEMLYTIYSIFGIIGLNTIGSMFHYDVDTVCDDVVQKTYGKKIKEIQETVVISENLKKLNIVVYDEKNTDIKKDVDGVEKVFIPQHVFQELLPVLQSPYSQEDIPALISSYFYTIERSNLARKITGACFHCKDALAVDPLTRNDINNLTARIIREEVRVLLITAMLCQFPYAGNAQAILLRKKIHQLSERVQNIALSNGVTAIDAKNIKDRFTNTFIAYVFNRVGYMDPLIIVPALVEGGVKGFVSLFNGLIPLVLVNQKPFLTIIDSIIFETRITDEFTGAGKTIDEKSNLRDGLFVHLSRMGESVSGYLNPQNWVTDIKSIAVVRNNILHASISSLEENGYYTGKDTDENILDALEKDFSNITFTSIDIQVGNVVFPNYLKLLAYLISQFESNERLVRYVLYKNIKEVYGVYEMLNGHIKATESTQKIVEKLSQILVTEEHLENEEERIYDMVISKLHSDEIQRDTNFRDTLIVFDLDMATQEHTEMIGGIEGISVQLYSNLKFLIYLSQTHGKDAAITKQCFKNFHDSMLVFYVKEGEKNELSRIHLINSALGELANQEQIDFYNNIFQGEEYMHVQKYSGKQKTDMIAMISSLSKIPAIPFEMGFSMYRGTLELMFGREFKNVGAFFEYMEHYAGKDNFEVINILLLIQSPYVTALKYTVKDTIQQLDKNGRMPEFSKKLIIWMTTSLLSMSTKSYIGMVVGMDLMTSILGMTKEEAIQEAGKIAMISGGNLVSGRTQNALMANDSKFYNITSLKSPEKLEKTFIQLLGGERERRDIKRSMERLSKLMIGADVAVDTIVISLLPSMSELITDPIKRQYLALALQQDQTQKFSDWVYMGAAHLLHPLGASKTYAGKVTPHVQKARDTLAKAGIVVGRVGEASGRFGEMVGNVLKRNGKNGKGGNDTSTS